MDDAVLHGMKEDNDTLSINVIQEYAKLFSSYVKMMYDKNIEAQSLISKVK